MWAFEVGRGAASRVRLSGFARRFERVGSLPAVRDQSEDGIQVAGTRRGGGDVSFGSLASAADESPKRTAAAVEAKIVSLRGAHPAWGARKLRRRLSDVGRGGLAGGTRRSPRFCGATAASMRPRRPSTRLSSASSIRVPTGSGRWTSRGTWRCGPGGAAIL